MKLSHKLLLLTICLSAALGFHARGDDGGGYSFAAKYWFDHSPKQVSFSPGHLDIPVTDLADGLHSLNVLLQRDGEPTSIATRWFVKTSAYFGSSNAKVSLMLDGKPWQTLSAAPSGNLISLDLPTNTVAEGLHLLSGRVEINGAVSSSYSQWFVKTMSIRQGSEYKASVFVDGTPLSILSIPATSNDLISIPLDMNRVPVGLHTLCVQVISPSGIPTGVREALFIKVPSESQLATMKGYYTIDGKPAGELAPSFDRSTFHLDIDASSLTSGLHSVGVYLASPEGLVTEARTAWFIKTPNGGEGVKSYEYWINDDYDSSQKVEFDKVLNPMQLIKLIDVPEQPFRTSSYSFAMENGQPTLYPKNEFQVRFYDPDGRLTLGSTPYTDVRSPHPISEPTLITAPLNSFAETIGEGEIKWYTLSAEQGDSIAFRLSGGGMTEFYAPDGSLLASRIGADATKVATATLTQNGTYYLAVHDLTSSSKRVNVGFDHVPKYAVIDFTPDESSYENLLIATLKGNGFDSLESVWLENESGRIECTEFSKTDNYECLVMFDFDEHPEERGDYRFMCSFRNEEEGGLETVQSYKTLAISDSKPTDIKVRIEPTRIARTPYEVNIVVENNSNCGYYGVPLNIAVKDFSSGGSIELMNFDFARSIDNSSSPYYHIDNLLGSGESGVFIPTIVPYLAPYEKQVFTIGYISRPMERITMYAWAGTPWSEDAKIIASKSDWTSEEVAEHLNHNYLSLFDVMDIYMRAMEGNENIPAEVTGMSPILRAPQSQSPNLNQLGELALSTGKAALWAAGNEGNWVNRTGLSHSEIVLQNAGYSMDDEMYENSGLKRHDDIRRGMLNVGDDIIQAGLTDNDVPGNVDSLGHLINARNNWHGAFNQPSPDPVNVDSYQSGDPNEMHGYTSPSGDSHIGIGVTEVSYAIEFENDPEIANAAACRIEVTDILDKDRFNLSTFRPEKMIIGEKEVELPESNHFVRTLDMRPEINSIAELTFDFDETTGEANWSIRTLDALTLEPTKYFDDGILPVNDGTGRGVGYLTFSIGLRDGLSDGTAIDNKASIIFDDNEAIETPVYRNVTDYILPESKIVSVETEDNMLFVIEAEGTDSGSGIWYYNLYMRSEDSSEWSLVRSMIETDTFTYEADSEVEGARFATTATDRAGNTQKASFLNVVAGDADGNGKVDSNDVVLTRNYYTGKAVEINRDNADVTLDGKIDTQDATGIRNLYLDKQSKVIRKRITRRK